MNVVGRFGLTVVVACLLGASCSAAVFNQITLMGEYLVPGGHPGIPYSSTPTDWTVWDERREQPGEFDPDVYYDLFPNDDAGRLQ